MTRLALGAFVISMLAISPAVGSAQVVSSFSDVTPIHTNYQAIDDLRENEVVVGYSDGSYGASLDINRAEFLKIVMEVSDHELGGSDCFPDIKNEWFAQYVCAATDAGLVEGYPDGTFKPGQNINFAEASKIINNVLQVGEPVTGATWFEGYVRVLDDVDAIPSYIDNFNDNVTRADMAEMIWRINTDTTYKVSNTYENIEKGVAVKELGGELGGFDSCAELATYFENNSESQYYYPLNDFVMAEESASTPSPTPDSKADAAPSVTAGAGEGAAADEFSSTNVQVAGVDEADIVKNDGKYVYLLKSDTVRIVEAFPPSSMKELDQITFADSSFYPSEMYVDGDRLVVIGWSYDSFTDISYNSLTKVYVFDISDRSNVDLMRSLEFEGDYNSSRKVGDNVYVVMNQYNYYLPWEVDPWIEDDLVPAYRDSKGGASVEPLVTCGDVRYMPGVIDTTSYVIVAAIPVDTAEGAIDKEVIIGSSGDIYASQDNLYLAEEKYSWWWDENNEETTYIHRLGLNGASLSYDGVGEVPGTVLNQFSMDEDGNYFRIATTKGGWWTDGPSNNVYVLDKDMKTVGKVEGLAPGETIYSARFMGDRLYMVTFEQIDPLFVVDLSNPTSPAVLGELHIPGVSQYLHPFGENYLIGFGLDTESQEVIDEAGFSWFQGMKISMFDVSDVNNPIELHKTAIGDRGTTSELLYNHKALLFDEAKEIMAFPVAVAEIPESVKNSDLDVSSWVYGDTVFQGAYIYDVSVDGGFDLKGTVTHYDESELGPDFEYFYWYGDDRAIDRILYMGDYYYTTSEGMVQANKMGDLSEVAGLTLAN